MNNEIMETLETAITKAPTFELTNKKLLSHTKAIEKLMTATKRNMFEISARLLVIRNENLFEKDGFKDVFDYAEKLFGYKKNMVYKMTTTAEKFIEKDATGKEYVSILTHENEDYTVSQLIELNSLEPDTAIKLDELEVISPKMLTKEIREVVKAYKNGEIDENGNFVSSNSESEEETESEEEIESEPKSNEVEKDEIDGTALAVIDAIKDIDNILQDSRIISDTMKVAKLQEMKKFLESIEL
jgi:hypothetical protein